MLVCNDNPDSPNETTEKKILRLMDEQARQAREVKRLQELAPHNQAAIKQLQQRHRDTVNELIEALYDPLYKALKGLDPRLHNAGAQYTEMVHDFFLKLLEGRVSENGEFDTFTDLRRFVSTVLMNQFRDHLRRGQTLREHQSAIAPIAQQKQRYFEERYRVSYLDFLDKLEQWECSENLDYQQAARVALLRYVAGEQWGVIAQELGISDERVTKLRKLLAQEFDQREAPTHKARP